MKPRVYHRLEELGNADTAFVLDTSAFQEIRKSPQPLQKLEILLEWKMNPTIIVPDAAKNLPRDLESETRYLMGLAEKMRTRENYFSTMDVVQELREYYRKAEKRASDLHVLKINDPKIESFLAAITHVTCVIYNHCVPRVQEVVKAEKAKFNEYYGWLTEFRMNRDRLPTNGREYTLSKLNNLSKNILALTLCVAQKKPTILLTGNVTRLCPAARDMFNPSITHPELPPNKIEVYGGFEEGWELITSTDYSGQKN